MPQRNEAADRLLGILAGQQVDGPVAQVLDAALAEERRLVVREIRERFKDDAPTAATSTLAIRRILDEVAGESR